MSVICEHQHCRCAKCRYNLNMGVACPPPGYIYTYRHGSYIFLGLHIFPFSLPEWYNTTDSVQSLCQTAEVFVGLGTFKDRKKRGLKKIKEAPCLHLWSVTVTAWSAISSSPTAAVSCAAGRRPRRPPAPRTLAVGVGGLCSTWPHPGMTSAGRGR